MADDRIRKSRSSDERARGGTKSPPDGRAPDAGASDTDALEQWARPAFLWQMPTIIIAGGLIVLGIATIARQAPENDFTGVMDVAAAHLEANQLDEAHALLTGLIAPHVDDATPFEQARYHALAADWTWLEQHAEEIDSREQHQAICDHYLRALDLGLIMSPQRLERWGLAALRVDRPALARTRLDDLDQMMSVRDVDPTTIRPHRNLLARRLIEHELRSVQGDADAEGLLELLASYRNDSRITPADIAWAMAREAELRLRTGRPQQAVDRLLLDFRRLEQHVPQPQSSSYGELYMLLGWGNYDLGDFTQARDMLVMAQGLLTGGEPRAGRVHLLLGRVALAEDDLDRAFDHFDIAVTQYAATDTYLAAIQGRAEVQSIRGEHARAIEDYQHLVREMTNGSPGQDDVTAGRVAAGLIDRHDASLAAGRIKLALDYAQVAEKLYPPLDVPHDLTLRLAVTSRQVAEDLLAQASEAPTDDQRREAAAYFGYAGEYFLQRARALVASTTEVDAWAESLWLAADSFDKAGRHDRAIDLFTEYLAGRAEEPRRAEARYRLGGLHQAVIEHDAAIEQLETLLANHPRSPYAAQAHVPLAECYRAVGRIAEAEQHLLEVLSGGAGLGPESTDYRDSLIAIGRMYREDQRFVEAIERLDEAVQRYPDDQRYPRLLFWLADSYRGRAAELEEERTADPTTSLARVAELESERDEMLAIAQSLFAQVGDLIDAGHHVLAGDELEDLQRLAWLAQGDCEYALVRYRSAIETYDRAARRYSDHHSSLYALAQIVNCLTALGDSERARAAHERALARLNRLPEEAFNAPDALLDRAAWERWLHNAPPPVVRSASVN